MVFLPFLWSLVAVASISTSRAATAAQWRDRSIYQVIIDRYALPDAADTTKCNVSEQTWCGGTWSTLQSTLDYIQNAGFTAIWISPIQQNYEGSRTPYGDAYHGYWIADSTQINKRFGTEDDLKNLIAEIHRRGMYVMVDVVVNNVMALSTNPDYSSYMFKDASEYHPYCPIDWNNNTSVQDCWLGDLNVTLPDVDTTNANVISTYNSWINQLVQTYDIDGLRIDAAKHVDSAFWQPFCESSGVFCIGEVFGGLNVEDAAEWQGPMDSVLNYPMYTALTQAFAIPGPGNISAVVGTLSQGKQLYKDMTVLGNFLENQDLPRWAANSVDIQSLFNAMTFNFMSDGIPIVYYGQEQGFSGSGDPYNREPLWPSNYTITSTYQFIQQLNQFRNFLVNSTGNTSDPWTMAETQVLTSSQYGIAIMKGEVISVMTNIGSPPQNNTQISVSSPYPTNTALTNVLTCQQWVVGSGGTLDVQYTEGGKVVVLVPSTTLENSEMCKGQLVTSQGQTSSSVSNDGVKLAAGLEIDTLLAVGLFSSVLGFSAGWWS